MPWEEGVHSVSPLCRATTVVFGLRHVLVTGPIPRPCNGFEPACV